MQGLNARDDHRLRSQKRNLGGISRHLYARLNVYLQTHRKDLRFSYRARLLTCLNDHGVPYQTPHLLHLVCSHDE